MSGPLTSDSIMLPLIDGDTILDVACGRGRYGYLLRTNYWCTKTGREDKEPKYLVGLDIFIPFLKKVKYHRIYDDVVCCHVSFLPFKRECFEVVLASEILEHLEKWEGALLLKEIERLSTKALILTTPRYVRKRGGLLTPEGFNPYERHVSGWSIKELRCRGYRVYGAGFLPFALFPILNALFSPISFFFPRFSSHLIAIKYKRQRYQS